MSNQPRTPGVLGAVFAAFTVACGHASGTGSGVDGGTGVSRRDDREARVRRRRPSCPATAPPGSGDADDGVAPVDAGPIVAPQPLSPFVVV